MTHPWLSVLADLADKAVPCVLITVMEARGSTPRDAGTKMIVTATEQFGTIGGGNLEFQAIGEARKLLSEAIAASEVKVYPLGPKLAQCCGGAVSVFLEPFLPSGKKVFLFGAGHVGREVVAVLSALPVEIRWIDERAGEFPEDLPKNCKKIITAAPLSELKEVAEGAFVIVMTHNHDLDYDIVRDALKNRKFSYLGLIGSDTKRARFEKRLLADGLTEADLGRLVCPLGIAGVTGKHPREIAIAVAAEVLTLGLASHL